MCRITLVAAATVAFMLAAGCAKESKTASMNLDEVRQTSFLSTYRQLQPQGPSSWRFVEPTNRLARYDKFIIDDIELTLMKHGSGQRADEADLKRVRDYMRQALTDALEPEYRVVTAPAGDVAEVRVALTDAFRDQRRIGVSMQAEVIDAVSNVQLAALVEGRRGKNVAFNRFWTENDAKQIMDEWARRFRAVVDQAHAAGEDN